MGRSEWVGNGNTRDNAAGEHAFDGFRVDTPRAWLNRNERHGAIDHSAS